jgi:16S rRNA G1207 methylase RsmC
MPEAEPATLHTITVNLAGRPTEVFTAPGVFSAHRLDPGTAVLLRHEARLRAAPASPPSPDPVHRAPDPRPAGQPSSPPDAVRPAPDTGPGAQGGAAGEAGGDAGPAGDGTVGGGNNLLDLGCGWGPLALTLARLYPASVVWAVDTNPRALDLTRRNAQHLGLTNIRAVLPEDVDPGVVFDLIWSNPPIRIGKAALHQMLMDWLGRLSAAGHADLVVQKNLGADSLAAWINAEAGFPTRKLASAKGYRVLRATR